MKVYIVRWVSLRSTHKRQLKKKMLGFLLWEGFLSPILWDPSR